MVYGVSIHNTGLVNGFREDRMVTSTSKDSRDCVKLFETKGDFMLIMIKIHEIVKASGKPNYTVEQISVFSGIDCNYLEQELDGYNDRIIVKLMRYGAPIGHASGIASVNGGIDNKKCYLEEYVKLQYPKVDNLVELIQDER